MLCGLWLFRKDEKHYKCLFFCVGASLFVIPKLILFFYQNLEVIPTGRIDIIYFPPIIIESKIKSCTFHEWITLLQFLVKKKKVERGTDCEKKCQDVMRLIIKTEWRAEWHLGFRWQVQLSQTARQTGWLPPQAAHIWLVLETPQ